MRRVNLRYLAIAIVTTACQSGPVANQDDGPNGGSGNEIPAGAISLGVGEAVEVDGGAVRVTFEGVTEDSRCASDVVCVWEGRVSVRLGLDVEVGADASVVLTIPGTEAAPDTRTVAGYVATLHAVAPYPVSTAPTPSNSYSASISVSPAP